AARLLSVVSRILPLRRSRSCPAHPCCGTLVSASLWRWIAARGDRQAWSFDASGQKAGSRSRRAIRPCGAIRSRPPCGQGCRGYGTAETSSPCPISSLRRAIAILQLRRSSIRGCRSLEQGLELLNSRPALSLARGSEWGREAAYEHVGKGLSL